jgi:hypothetical protein
VRVTDVVEELLANKKAKGRSHLYLTDLRIRLTRFANAHDRTLCEITTGDIDKFLESLEVSARSQNNFRATIGTLFRFGQAKGYVAKDHPGVSHVDKASHAAEDVQVFTPDEMQKLLRAAKDELVPAIALGGFAGIRSEELKRLTWEDIHLQEGHIEIKSAKSKTRVHRLIPIQENLKAWLQLYAKKIGAVVPFANLALQIADECLQVADDGATPAVPDPRDASLLCQPWPHLVGDRQTQREPFEAAPRRCGKNEARITIGLDADEDNLRSGLFRCNPKLHETFAVEGRPGRAKWFFQAVGPAAEKCLNSTKIRSAASR